jgi:2-haloacid dehalogenase
MAVAEVKALTFDVFGTVVDWRGSIIDQCTAFGAERGIDRVNWGEFADAWRAGYAPSMNRVRQGELSWTNIDALHRMVLDPLLDKFGIAGLSQADKDHLNRVWHRLKGWSDSVPGLTRLRQRFILATLSNGNVALLTNMAKYAGLPWDCILSAELAHHYKPDPEVYKMAADLLGLQVQEVMMVAAHKNDLRAAQAVGLQAAFVPRPGEHGPDRDVDTTPDPAFQYHAKDFVDLATQLGV